MLKGNEFNARIIKNCKCARCHIMVRYFENSKKVSFVSRSKANSLFLLQILHLQKGQTKKCDDVILDFSK